MNEAPGTFLTPRIVGRESARQAIGDALSWIEGSPRVVLLSAEAGRGKTRLSHWARERAITSMPVLVGEADAVGARLPLGVFRDAFARLRRGGDDANLMLDDDTFGAFPRMVLDPASGQRIQPERLFDASLSYFGALNARSGALLILENMHEAQELSCEIALHLARAFQGAQLSILITYREEDASPALKSLRTQLVRDRLAAELILPALTRDEVGQMITFTIRAAPSVAAIDAVFATSKGNAFAVEEVLKESLRDGRLVEATGEWEESGHAPLPGAVREALLARLSRLDPVARRLVEAAAVVGDGAEHWLLSAVAELSGDDVAAAVDRARATGLLMHRSVGPGPARLSFRHSLARDAVYADLGLLGPMLHARAMHAIEERVTSAAETRLEELLVHALGADDGARAFEYSLGAGRRALRLSALREADRHFKKALAFWQPNLGEARRAEALLERARILTATAEFADAADLVAQAIIAADVAQDPALSAVARALAASVRWDNHQRDGVLDDLREASRQLAQLPNCDRDQAEVLKLLARTSLRSDDTLGAVEAARAGLELGNLDVGVRLSLRISLAAGLAATGLFDEGRRKLLEVLDEARTHGDVINVQRALTSLARCTKDRLARPLDEALSHIDDAIQVAEGAGLTQLIVRSLRWRSDILVELGRWADAELDLARALEVGLDERVALEFEIVHAKMLRRRGHFDGLDVRFASLARDARRFAMRGVELEARVGTARIALAIGDSEHALSEVSSILDGWSSIATGDEAMWTGLLLTGMEAAAGARSAPWATALSRRIGVSWPGPRATYVRALVEIASSRAADLDAVEFAAQSIEVSGRSAEAARMRTIAGLLTQHAGPSDLAGLLVREAQRIYQALGIDSGADLVGASNASVTPAPLTPREEAVMALVAEGRANKEIAEDLGIVKKTVDKHLENAFRKFGVRNRTEAVTAWKRRATRPEPPTEAD